MTQTIVVTFNTNGVVTAALNGVPLGTTSGAPTVIPGGYYSVLLNGPGDCINLPLFELSGPGVDIQDDMLGGEVDTHSLPIYFVPNSTYTWHIDRAQSIVYTFRTSSDVVGAATPTGSSSTSSKSSTKPTSQDVVGSALAPFRGTLQQGSSDAGGLAPEDRLRGEERREPECRPIRDLGRRPELSEWVRGEEGETVGRERHRDGVHR